VKKLLAVSIFKHHQSIDGKINTQVKDLLAEASVTIEETESIYRMNTLVTMEERCVMPSYREGASDGIFIYYC
jgi:nitrate reductase beta subunit